MSIEKKIKAREIKFRSEYMPYKTDRILSLSIAIRWDY